MRQRPIWIMSTLSTSLLLLVLGILAANAQTQPAAPSTAPNITWITTPLLQVLGTLILAVGTWAVQRLLSWLGLKVSAQAADNLDQALEKAVTFGIQQAQEVIKSKGWDHIDTRNAVLREALPYMQDRFSDTLRAVGANPRAGEMIKDALDRAFPQAAAKAADSPATPPKTAPNPPIIAELPTQPSVRQTI